MAKAIMIQGTMSNVGKSLLTAALCRIFRQDGYSIAPFKSQNMALNSFITPDGDEIGRAQALQAEAAGIVPSAAMNPILLKPTGDRSSQVIVNGQVRSNLTAAEYFRTKRELIPEIMQAYNSLADTHEIIVIEGAGSPAELNLRQDDIVNMGLASMLRVPVLLVGNIDPGGIFAQLIGTISLLEPQEQVLVKGLIVNQFRGDSTLFADGVSILEQHSGVPVLGVIPYLRHSLEDEDSLSTRLQIQKNRGVIDIAVIRLPHISNFTDFDVFSQYSGVSIRYIVQPEAIGNPDLLIIPGTKNTIADMQWMHNSGIARAVNALARRSFPIFGICGGFQILGAEISDPDGTECGGTVHGLGLLPNCKTVFQKEKTQTRTAGHFLEISGFFSCLSNTAFEGYEVHMGVTENDENILTDCGGAFAGNVAGCYVHGIFDRAEVCGTLVRALYQAKGLQYHETAADRSVFRNQQLNLLADCVRQNLDMQAVYKIMEDGV